MDPLWTEAGSRSGFTPRGPWIETDVAVDDARISLRLDDVEVASASTADLARGPFEVVAYLSELVELRPGDVVRTGAPGTTAPLRPGVSVTAEVAGIGALRCPVVRSAHAWEAVRTTRDVAPHADWVEVGTSLIKRYGTASVSEVVAAAGTTPVLADLKTADDAATESGMAFTAGARGATVLALAADATIDRCVEVATEAGGETVLDLVETGPLRRDALLARLPADVVVTAHVGKDAQAGGAGVEAALGPWTRGRSVAVAGGLGLAEVVRLRAAHPDLRVIVGSAITSAPAPGRAAATLSEAIRGAQR